VGDLPDREYVERFLQYLRSLCENCPRKGKGECRDCGIYHRIRHLEWKLEAMREAT